MRFVIRQFFLVILFFMLPISDMWAADGEDLTEFFTPPEFVPEMPMMPMPVITPPITKPPVVSPVTANPIIGNTVDLPTIHPAIPLLDENGTHVLDSQKPYSTRTSCGGGSGCHDIDKISHAYHFEMGRDESDDKFGLKLIP